ncbi:MAG TPA: MBL fold metallo-hydrolase [Pyrinomonadaceae bacterium]|jgi:glyoxylase-like metal-dependent hydrolase (beta-lactamase superfamily II)|nr:MBL fold metallo-hydrolase [Pyrinomonadaceae bacterium]
MGIQVNKIQPDLYLVIGDTYKSNSTVFVSGDDVLLVDALASKKDAEDLRSFIELELKKQVRFILSTHYFSDHLAALNTFPRATVLAHENYLDTFESEQFRSDEEIAFFREPNILISDRIKIRWGSFTLDVFHNPGHTSSTLAVDVPEADLLFVGDTVVGNILYLRYSTAERLLSALDRLRSKSRPQIISSHGGVRGADAIDNAAYYLEQLRSRSSMGVDESILKAPLEDFLPASVTPVAYERLYHERNLQTIVARASRP